MKRIGTWLGVVACMSAFAASGSWAQVSVKTPGQDVKVGKRGDVNVQADGVTAIATEGNTASVTVGGIDANADIQGVTVINGKVWIDGKEIPPNITRYVAPRDRTVYLIKRNNGAVSVTTEEGGRK